MTHDASARLVAVPRTARLYTLGASDAPETWLALHGYGQLGRFFARRLAPHAGPQRRILVPEAPSRFYLDGAYRRVGASWMTREERTSDIADTHAYLDAVVADGRSRTTMEETVTDDETARGATPPLVGFGFSQGGMVLVRYAAARPGLFSRLVLWGSAPPDDVDLSDALLPPLTFVLGTDDAYLTPERRAGAARPPRRLRRALRRGHVRRRPPRRPRRPRPPRGLD